MKIYDTYAYEAAVVRGCQFMLARFSVSNLHAASMRSQREQRRSRRQAVRSVVDASRFNEAAGTQVYDIASS
jgi:hypothetical protein